MAETMTASGMDHLAADSPGALDAPQRWHATEWARRKNHCWLREVKLQILTQFIYSALASQGVTSSQALADPFNRHITLDRDFVSITAVQGLIGDPHFVTRDRMGRDLAFFCNIVTLGWSSMPRGISIDEQTALLIDARANATVVGNSTVYFLQAPGARSARPKLRSPTRTLRYTASTPPAPSISPPGRDRRPQLRRLGQRRRPKLHATRRLHLLTQPVAQVCFSRMRPRSQGFRISGTAISGCPSPPSFGCAENETFR